MKVSNFFFGFVISFSLIGCGTVQNSLTPSIPNIFGDQPSFDNDYPEDATSKDKRGGVFLPKKQSQSKRKNATKNIPTTKLSLLVLDPNANTDASEENMPSLKVEMFVPKADPNIGTKIRMTIKPTNKGQSHSMNWSGSKEYISRIFFVGNWATLNDKAGPTTKSEIGSFQGIMVRYLGKNTGEVFGLINGVIRDGHFHGKTSYAVGNPKGDISGVYAQNHMLGSVKAKTHLQSRLLGTYQNGMFAGAIVYKI